MIYETPGSRQLPLQQEMFYPSDQPGPMIYDNYDDYRRPSPNDGVYRGEIQLDSMSRARSRGLYGEQETRFM